MKKIYSVLCVSLMMLSQNILGARVQHIINAYNRLAQLVHNKPINITDELLEQCYQTRLVPLLEDAATPDVKNAWKDVTTNLLTHMQQGDSAQKALTSSADHINHLQTVLRKSTIVRKITMAFTLVAVGIFTLGALTGATITHIIDHHR